MMYKTPAIGSASAGRYACAKSWEGNLYVAEVDNGRVQKFRPRAGANPNYLMAKPVVPVWQSGT